MRRESTRYRQRGRSRVRWIGGVGVAALLIVTAAGAVSPGIGASRAAAGSASPFATVSPTVSAAPTPSADDAAPSASASANANATKKPAAPKATAAGGAGSAGYRQITIVNAVDQTIWAAANQNSKYPLPVTGWKLDPGQSVTFNVPTSWGGRIWGRTGCSFNSAGAGRCQTGDCGDVFQCAGSGATPATLAEMTLNSFDGLDFYDVSLVDGSNLPMYINTTHSVSPDPVSPTGCYQGACTKAIDCPTAMQVKSGGNVVACETACAALGGDDYCCTGSWSGRQNCIPANWPVDYAKLVFKDAEPYAYSYAYDDSATMTCKGGCDYRITFGITPGS
jgi:Thaumatin family